MLDEFKAQFNKDKGVLRLVVLVSPTCPQCTSGAGWIQEYALKRNPKLDVKVYAVWYEMYPGEWDAFYLHSADSLWASGPDDKPTHLLTWGRTILRDRKKLTEKIAQLTGTAVPLEGKPEVYDALAAPAPTGK